MRSLYLSITQLYVLVRSTSLRLCDGSEECLRSDLSELEGADHGIHDALGVVVPPLGCGSAAPPKTFLFRVLF